MRRQREDSRYDGYPRTSSSGGQLSPLSQPHSSPFANSLQLLDALPALMLEVASPPSPTINLSRQSPIAQVTESLESVTELGKSVNIVMELSLDGEEVQYVNDAIEEVTGRDPDDVLFRPITDILAPGDTSTFADATQKLLEDDNNTVQLRVRLEMLDVRDDRSQTRAIAPIYVEVEGVGMLIREYDMPSHTMWVLKPVPANQTEVLEAAFPKDGHIAVEGMLCRICERDIATWFFAKHNETCDAVHRLEADITEADESLKELRRTVLKLSSQLGGEGTEKAEYQGVPFLNVSDSLQGNDGLQLGERKKAIQQHLIEAAEILQTAVQIESPAVREEETDLPFKLQRYLDPESEENLLKVTRWQRPATTDHAFALLSTHVEDQLRRKHKAIARMQSTIRYSEKTRHEWEDKVNQVLAEQDSSGSDSGSDSTGHADVSLAPTMERSDTGDSPPSHRKIAPQARLPVTLGHSGRPATSHGEAGTTVPPTPLPQHSAPVSPAAEQPLSASPVQIFARSRDASPTPTLLKPDRISPRLAPSDMVFQRHTRRPSKAFLDMPLSPRVSSAALNRSAAPSIKDFEIIKPISRGAFGSVFLAKKVTTGDYYAVKALKKSDMIAKNQITNVKAERNILIDQAASPYCVKLFFSFQSKEYLYLVMEYLNGGDCATLVKTLGCLPEDWARNYIAEVVLGLEYLHDRNIVHRDIKPDNLLIDSKGHIKLTDFGLSRIGLLNRQVAGPRPAYLRATSLRTATHPRPLSVRTNSSNSGAMSPDMVLHARQQGYFSSAQDSGSADESSGSESAGILPKHSRNLSKLSSEASSPSATNREPPKVVGTPDYLAPESILGLGDDDRTVDWWALGVVLYEFIYGSPPFHAETPSQVFDNIVSRRIDWHDDEIETSAEVRDLMDRLMCSDPAERLGSRGAVEVKKHAFFAGLDWETLCECEGSFIPAVTDPESTDYFDSRGAVHGFHDDDGKAGPSSVDVSPMARAAMELVAEDIAAQEDFGTFNFKNLPVLKQANDDMIRKLRVDSIAGQSLEAGMSVASSSKRLSGKNKARRKTSDLGGPPSPTTSNSSAASTPSRSSGAPTTPSTLPHVSLLPQHLRRPSELNALDRVKLTDDGDRTRRSSAPSRLRAGSGSSVLSDRSTSVELWGQRRQVSLHSDISQTGSSSESGSLPSTSPFGSPDTRGHSSIMVMDRMLDVLIAEDNPTSRKILDTLLTQMGCRCVCAEDGSQALAASLGSTRFDVIICDIHMTVADGDRLARVIRATTHHNQSTPIIGATSYEKYHAASEEGTLFSAVLAKPFSKLDLTRCLAKLGF